MDTKQAYQIGFNGLCARLGVDAGALVKSAEPKPAVAAPTAPAISDATKQAYQHGFMQVCTHFGVNPQELVKQSQAAAVGKAALGLGAKALPYAKHLALPAAGAVAGGASAKVQDHNVGQGVMGGALAGILAELGRANMGKGVGKLQGMLGEMKAPASVTGDKAVGGIEKILAGLRTRPDASANAIGGTAAGLGGLTAGGMAEENHPLLNRIRLMLGL